MILHHMMKEFRARTLLQIYSEPLLIGWANEHLVCIPMLPSIVLVVKFFVWTMSLSEHISKALQLSHELNGKSSFKNE